MLGAGVLNIYMQDDALAAGLPMIVLVYPFLVVFALAYLLRGRVSEMRN
ncbi:hypothetical protein [Rhizobium leguminosarum]|nr:hypothetical protein [Rhizobium leguminosarum]MBY5420399.1 hypothetical protein [Rhizobium leguminosarum]